MSKVTCCYLLSNSGKAYVEEFANSLGVQTQRKYFAKIGLLEEFGRTLPQPHAKNIGDDIYELRFVGREGQIRILYFFFYNDCAILTNGFVKKTKKTPKNQIETAKRRRKRFIENNSIKKSSKKVKRK